MARQPDQLFNVEHHETFLPVQQLQSLDHCLLQEHFQAGPSVFHQRAFKDYQVSISVFCLFDEPFGIIPPPHTHGYGIGIPCRLWFS